MNIRRRLLHLRRLLPVVIVRTIPIPWRWKRWIIWYLTPRFGVGVHAVIFDARGDVLTLRSSYSRRWQLPGGGVHYHEELEEAMRREAREEIGVELLQPRMVALMTDRSGHGLHGVFCAELGGQAIRLSEEHTDWCFMPADRLPPFYARFVERALMVDAGPFALPLPAD